MKRPGALPTAIAALFAAIAVSGAELSPADIWADSVAKRSALPGFHQEFDEILLTKSKDHDVSMKQRIQLEVSKDRWRIRLVSGSDTLIRIFDGANVAVMEEGGEEYVIAKHDAKQGPPLPEPYDLNDADWARASELKRLDCPISTVKHTCVVLQAPLKETVSSIGDSKTMKGQGTAAVAIDTDTGLIISARLTQQIVLHRQGRDSGYLSDRTYQLTNMRYGSQLAPALFSVPDGLKSVKELKRWDGARIKKQLAGQPAPVLSVTDIKGTHLSLADYKGKTILLDFFTTWCGPCRQDAPSIDKLYEKYGEKDLMVIGISVSEERSIVEKFLAAHPHAYPVVLTSENEMPRAYQVGEFPTYVVIDQAGNLVSAVSGDQGFGALRKLLKKAGLEPD